MGTKKSDVKRTVVTQDGMPAFLRELRGDRSMQQVADLCQQAGYDGKDPAKPFIDKSVVARSESGERKSCMAIIARVLLGREVTPAFVIE